MNTKIETLIAKYERQITQCESMLPFANPDTPVTLRDKELIEDWKIILVALRQADQQAQPPSYENIADMLPSILATGTEQCPLCGKTGMHQHSPEEIIIYRNGCKYGRSLTSPPAQPQARELTDEEIRNVWRSIFGSFKPVPNTAIQYGRAAIAADRAIRQPQAITTKQMLWAGTEAFREIVNGAEVDNPALHIFERMIAASQKEHGK